MHRCHLLPCEWNNRDANHDKKGKKQKKKSGNNNTCSTIDSNQRQSEKQQNKRKKCEEYDYLTSPATTILAKSYIEK